MTDQAGVALGELLAEVAALKAQLAQATARVERTEATLATPRESFCIKCHHRWETPINEWPGATYCGDCHRSALAAEARATSAEAQLQAAEKRIADLCDAHEEQFLRAESAEATVAQLRALLRDLEWIGMNDGRGVTHVMCPACSARKSRGSGHNYHCGLAALLTGPPATTAPDQEQTK